MMTETKKAAVSKAGSSRVARGWIRVWSEGGERRRLARTPRPYTIGMVTRVKAPANAAVRKPGMVLRILARSMNKTALGQGNRRSRRANVAHLIATATDNQKSDRLRKSGPASVEPAKSCVRGMMGSQ